MGLKLSSRWHQSQIPTAIKTISIIWTLGICHQTGHIYTFLFPLAFLLLIPNMSPLALSVFRGFSLSGRLDKQRRTLRPDILRWPQDLYSSLHFFVCLVPIFVLSLATAGPVSYCVYTMALTTQNVCTKFHMEFVQEKFTESTLFATSSRSWYSYPKYICSPRLFDEYVKR